MCFSAQQSCKWQFTIESRLAAATKGKWRCLHNGTHCGSPNIGKPAGWEEQEGEVEEWVGTGTGWGWIKHGEGVLSTADTYAPSHPQFIYPGPPGLSPGKSLVQLQVDPAEIARAYPRQCNMYPYFKEDFIAQNSTIRCSIHHLGIVEWNR